MDAKRPRTTPKAIAKGSKAKGAKAKGAKPPLSKESFIAEVELLKLYTEEDRYYREIRISPGPLELDWKI